MSVRLKLLQKIYQPVFKNLTKGTPEYQKVAMSGIAFNRYFDLFGTKHFIQRERVIADGYKLPKVSDRPYHVTQSLAIKISHKSCVLEGSTLTVEEVHEFLPLRNSDNSTTKTVAQDIVYPLTHSSEIKHQELRELYYHILCLCHILSLNAVNDTRNNNNEPSGMVTFNSNTGHNTITKPPFILSYNQICEAHRILMYPNPSSCPGQLRVFPIRISNYDEAVFPYPLELQGLFPEFLRWLNSYRYTNDYHPFFFACDVFLNFTHLHPFNDGNGRIGRILSDAVMAQYGLRPISLFDIDRKNYLNAVFQAQQRGERHVFYRLLLDVR